MAPQASLESYTREDALAMDEQHPLRHLREKFLIPSKKDLKRTALPSEDDAINESHDESIYLCGNSLGLQPRITSERVAQHFRTWATQGVFGHFKPLSGSPLPTWLDADEKSARRLAPIVGAQPDEVAAMQTLTTNLHLLMAAFYKPVKDGKHKIIIEGKAFPSDHYAVESQIRHHGLDPTESMIMITPSTPQIATLTTAHILSVIDAHADSTALLLLPGVQFYTGQLLDIPTITAHAHKHNIFVLWDLAHAAGNVPLHLHDWNVDAAVWCHYKYINAGPGAIGGLFVHSKHGNSTSQLAGWWGNSKKSRFAMNNQWDPMPGAAGFQISNPSVIDMTSVNASLEIFEEAGGMDVLREKSLKLTNYLWSMLVALQNEKIHGEKGAEVFRMITPASEKERGAQVSVLLAPQLLEHVMEGLEEGGVVVDERKPDVIRVAPAPLYNNFRDVWEFMRAFRGALESAVGKKMERRLGEGGKGELQMTT